MAVENLKSTVVTNLDATPIVAPTAGEGASGNLREQSGYQTASASASATSTYQFVRIPTNAVVKSVVFESEAQTAGKLEVGLYYSSSTTDGTPVASQGSVVDSDFFASDIDCASAVTPTEVLNQAGNYTLDLRNSPIWEAAGLSADPGGFFDVVGTVHTTAVTTGTGKWGVSVRWAE